MYQSKTKRAEMFNVNWGTPLLKKYSFEALLTFEV
jgi:hypothetical protein